eukprot:1154707-Pelagomonas_calceolata.AAC.5
MQVRAQGGRCATGRWRVRCKACKRGHEEGIKQPSSPMPPVRWYLGEVIQIRGMVQSSPLPLDPNTTQTHKPAPSPVFARVSLPPRYAVNTWRKRPGLRRFAS